MANEGLTLRWYQPRRSLLHSVHQKTSPLFLAAEETQSADSMTAEYRSCSARRMPRRDHSAFLLSLEHTLCAQAENLFFFKNTPATIVAYFHGTSTACDIEIEDELLPPGETGMLQESTRKKNLDCVFFTKDKNSAQIYAGRAVSTFGGDPVVYKFEPSGAITCHNDQPGTTVFSASAARVLAEV